MPHYGLIGKTLTHSFSKSYFEEKFAALGLPYNTYSNFELKDASEIRQLVRSNREIAGLNVTVPFKEGVIQYLDRLDKDASVIGAVNCIRIVDGTMTGYNTDSYGFSQSIKPFIGGHTRALVLGTGGSARAVEFVLTGLGLEVFRATTSLRKKKTTDIHYRELNEYVLKSCTCIVNCTPLGMLPRVDEAPEIPYELITKDHLAYDLVYNPPETLFLKRAKARGATVVNGLSMLRLQAEKSWEIWNPMS
jgi:shikimate dehydrogenase